jgi:hypothetical protein
MKNSELRERVGKWLETFEDLTGSIPNRDKLAKYLVTCIEGEVFIERDEDVITIKKDGKSQYARVISENKASGTVSIELLDDKSQVMLTYAALKKMSPGAEIVSALDSLASRSG